MRSLVASVLFVTVTAMAVSAILANDSLGVYEQWVVIAIIGAAILGAFLVSAVRGYRRS